VFLIGGIALQVRSICGGALLLKAEQSQLTWWSRECDQGESEKLPLADRF